MATITKLEGASRKAYGKATVTGSLTVATGLNSVHSVTYSVGTAPNPTANVVIAKPSATAGSIDIEVYQLVLTEGTPNTISFSAATTAVDVYWEAIGE